MSPISPRAPLVVVFPLLALLALLLLPRSGAAQGTPPANVSGAWDFSVVTENGTGTPRVVFEQEGSEVTGSYSSPRLGVRRLQGSVQGDTLTFRIAPSPDAGDVIMLFVGVLQGTDSLVGTVDFGGMGGATFSARRASPQGDRD